MICPAVRVENALPFEERYAPVTAFGSADGEGGTAPGGIPSSPPFPPKPLEIATVPGAPVMRKAPATFPTRSTTTICARTPCACASPTACATIRSTSAWVRKSWGLVAATVPPPDEPEHDASKRSAPASDALATAGRTRASFRLEVGIPWRLRVVESVAEEAVRGDLLLRRLRSTVAFAARGDRRHGNVRGAFRFRDVVAIGARRLRMHPMVELRARHPAMVDADGCDLPFGRHSHVVARLADAHLEQFLRDFLRLAVREGERGLALGRARLAHAPQQALARHAERLLEAVGHSLQGEVRVELLDDVHGVGRFPVRHFAGGDRRLELKVVASLAVLRHRHRLEHAARGIGLVAALAFELRASVQRRADATRIEVSRMRKSETRFFDDRSRALANALRPALVDEGEPECGMVFREIGNIHRRGRLETRADVAVACHAEGVVVAVRRLGPLVLAMTARATRSFEERRGLHFRSNVMADRLVALEAGTVLHVLEGDLVACRATRFDRLVREDQWARIPEAGAHAGGLRYILPWQVEPTACR